MRQPIAALYWNGFTKGKPFSAIAGDTAGAYWGREAIPQRWLDALHEREVVEKVAWDLVGLREAL